MIKKTCKNCYYRTAKEFKDFSIGEFKNCFNPNCWVFCTGNPQDDCIDRNYKNWRKNIDISEREKILKQIEEVNESYYEMIAKSYLNKTN